MRIDYEISAASELSVEELKYLKAHPKELDTFNDREVIHTRILIQVFFVAVSFIAISKIIAFTYGGDLSQFMNDVVVDTVFEVGAALLGAVATVFFIEHQQKKQFDDNVKLRKAIEKRIASLDEHASHRPFQHH